MHRRTRFAVAAVAAASSLLFTAACQNGEKGASAGSSTTPKKGPATLTADQAESVLLKAADLSAGWKADENTVIDSGDPKTYEFGAAKPQSCKAVIDLVNTGRLLTDYKMSRQVVFSDATGQSLMLQDVSGYERAADAERAVTALAATVKDCGSFETTYEGKSALAKAEVFEIPALGDQSTGLRVQFKNDDHVVDQDIAVIRVGAVISTVHNNWGEGARGEKDFDRAIHKVETSLKATKPTA
ncbi:hypothetical protein OHS33_11605 [Streptomyces sp. NBC_00536]|uniref:hypothetical protein n=1 Tax=Streptomyces sp. NBC_00536 TaxID=2975769 RepID=UPI002E82030D|nr:hypothetical protein [Streptomyces sp. NBC_00536]WUC78922.1 hypothetical protein OHS33_11605 [Streptomyces sp. NBC_00536]